MIRSAYSLIFKEAPFFHTKVQNFHTSGYFSGKYKLHGEYLYGLYPCLNAINAEKRIVYTVFLKNEDDLDGGDSLRKDVGIKNFRRLDVFKYAELRNIPIKYVPSTQLNSMSGNRPHQGVVMDVDPLLVRDLSLTDVQTDCMKFIGGKPPVWLFLNEIRDPMNVGAILRSCLYFGIDRVILSRKVSRLSPVVSKASAGALETMDIRGVANVSKFLWTCSKHFEIIGTCSPKEEENLYQTVNIHDLTDFQIRKPTMILFGNEGEGLSIETAEYCHKMLSIKPYGDLPEGLDSLNVSVSAGLLLHQVNCARKTVLQSNGPVLREQ